MAFSVLKVTDSTRKALRTRMGPALVVQDRDGLISRRSSARSPAPRRKSHCCPFLGFQQVVKIFTQSVWSAPRRAGGSPFVQLQIIELWRCGRSQIPGEIAVRVTQHGQKRFEASLYVIWSSVEHPPRKRSSSPGRRRCGYRRRFHGSSASVKHGNAGYRKIFR